MVAPIYSAERAALARNIGLRCSRERAPAAPRAALALSRSFSLRNCGRYGFTPEPTGGVADYDQRDDDGRDHVPEPSVSQIHRRSPPLHPPPLEQHNRPAEVPVDLLSPAALRLAFDNDRPIRAEVSHLGAGLTPPTPPRPPAAGSGAAARPRSASPARAASSPGSPARRGARAECRAPSHSSGRCAGARRGRSRARCPR
jgi:hypothetical protein